MKRTALLVVTAALAMLLVGVGALVGVQEPAGAAFPGKNGRIAFSSPRDGDVDIYTVRPNGSGLRQVTNAAGDDYWPQWSPDGTKIVFSSDRDRHDFEIYVKDLASGRVTQLTDNFENPGEEGYEIQDGTPAWSPDGSQIVFYSFRDYCYDLWVMDANGSNERRLTDNCALKLAPAWSPDGSKIVFERSTYTDSPPDIWVMNADGSFAEALTNTPATADMTPDWSPDGRWIVWDQDGIWKMSADGSQKVRLSSSGVSGRQPSWSPDGGKIVFARNGALVKMDADGTDETTITDPQDYFVYELDWGPKPKTPK